jgi:hypothetical protein
MKAPFTITAITKDADGAVIDTHVINPKTQADLVAVQEAVASALVTLGKSKVK